MTVVIPFHRGFGVCDVKIHSPTELVIPRIPTLRCSDSWLPLWLFPPYRGFGVRGFDMQSFRVHRIPDMPIPDLPMDGFLIGTFPNGAADCHASFSNGRSRLTLGVSRLLMSRSFQPQELLFSDGCYADSGLISATCLC
jgi:hypothetical protein